MTIAAFLIVSGLTGAIISWDHELDDLLNPHLLKSNSEGSPRDPLDLAREVEARDPRLRVTFIPLMPEKGDSLALGVSPLNDPSTDKHFELGFNQVFLDPVTGAEIGRREHGGVWPLGRENIVSFLYVLHYSLHMPEMWGIDTWGLWFMGAIAIIWTLDCFVGFYLTLPARRAARRERAAAVAKELSKGFWARWKPAWKIKTSGSAYRINFDIHRAFGLWFWLLLFIVAFTAFSLNLYREVFYPVMSTVSQVTPTPFDVRTPVDHDHPITPVVGNREILERARDEAARRSWSEPAGAISYSGEFGVYTVMFFHPGDDHGAAGVGPAELYYDAIDGRYLGDRRPWKGTAADIFVQAQFPLHSGRILGLPGRILISFMGLVVAALSITGIVIWYRKRRARARVANTVTSGSAALSPAE